LFASRSLPYFPYLGVLYTIIPLSGLVLIYQIYLKFERNLEVRLYHDIELRNKNLNINIFNKDIKKDKIKEEA